MQVDICGTARPQKAEQNTGERFHCVRASYGLQIWQKEFECSISKEVRALSRTFGLIPLHQAQEAANVVITIYGYAVSFPDDDDDDDDVTSKEVTLTQFL